MTKVIVGGGSSVGRQGTIRPIGTYVGEFDPSLGLPTSGSGVNGTILKGDYWKASGAGTIASLSPFTLFAEDDLIYATVNNASVVGDFFGNKGTGGSMVYPGAGLAKSTGSAWDTSVTDNSANWNTAYGWGDHAGLYWPLSGTGNQNGDISIIPDGDYTRTLNIGDATHNLLGFNLYADATYYGSMTYQGQAQFNAGINISGDDTENITAGFTDGVDNTTFNVQHNQILLSHRTGRAILFNNTGLQLTLGSDATGDIFYRNSSGYLTRLPAGTNGHVLTLASGIPSWAAPSGGGTWGSITGTLSSQTDLQTTLDAKWSLSTGGTLTGANTITGSSSNTLKYEFPSLGTTVTDGAGGWFANSTAASAGSQQQSPSLVWEGKGWKTNATAASQSVKFASYVLPVQGAANPTGTWTLASSINGGAYGTSMTYTSAGLLTAPDLTLSSGILTLSSNRIILFNGGLGTIGGNLNSGLAFRANANSTVVSGGYYRFFNTSGNYTATSGELIGIGNEMSFAPTSGTATLKPYKYSGTINQTGGANGKITLHSVEPTITAAITVTGYYYNPTNPSNISGTHLSWEQTSGTMSLQASTTGQAPFRIAHGTAPSSPVDGDIWTTTAGLYVRINGSTVGPLS